MTGRGDPPPINPRGGGFMMRKLLTLVVALLAAAAAVAAVALADDAPTRTHTRWFAGAVTAVGPGSLTVKVDRTGRRATELLGQTIAVSVPAGTPVRLGREDEAIALTDIQVGWRARVAATRDTAGAWAARRVHAGRGNHWFAGKLTAVGSGSITVAVGRTGKHDRQLRGQTLVVPVDASTQYLLGKERTTISLGDLIVGRRVGVVVHSPGGDLAQGMTAVRVHEHKAEPAAS
jgi:hypothetical protein